MSYLRRSYLNLFFEGLDPNKDTPVEVLHVVLLGFLKYFWRDAVSRLKPDAKAILMVRISSLDTSSLGLPPLSGKTLVQYAGSLTERDFRAIAQIAPFVLYELIPLECYDVWLSLSALVPLVWMPEIDDIEEYLVSGDSFYQFYSLISCPDNFNGCYKAIPRSYRSSHPKMVQQTETPYPHTSSRTYSPFWTSNSICYGNI